MSDAEEDLFADPVTRVPVVESLASWDPPERERVYYRSSGDGQLGWLVVRDGKSMIKLDRPMEDLVRPFREADWIPEKEHRPLTRAQCAQVAYEADLKLKLMLGMFDAKRTPWQNLHEEVRIKWAVDGPPGPPAVRRDVFRAIMGALSRVTK